MEGDNRVAKTRRGRCACVRGPRTSLTAAGAVAEPPCAVETKLTGGASPSASREEGRGGSDERDPPVSDRVKRESARAAPVWAGLRAV